MFKPLLILPILGLYFFISWCGPWQELAPGSTISASYLLDLIFILTVMIIRKKLVIIGELKLFVLLSRSVVSLLLAFACVSIAKYTNLIAPFKFVDHLLLQMLILAPFIEELVYRESILELQKKFGSSDRQILILNSLFFSLSHYSGIFLLPAEFHSFIYFQVLYTFPLGWLCTKAKLRSGGIAEPILIHLLFNLVFFFAVKNYGL